MSIDQDSRTEQPRASIRVNHWCCVSGCGQWGGFGIAKGTTEVQWWCWKHYPHKPNQAQTDAANIADAIGL